MPLSEFTGRIRRWISPDSHALPLNSRLPDLKVVTEQGARFQLGEAAQGWTLVYFYPRAETPGCTAQACSLRDAYAELLDRRVRVLGVSLDSPDILRRFRESNALPFSLISDPDGVLADAFQVPHLMGLARRQAYLFKDGALVWRDLHASTDRQAADVLATLDAHSPGGGLRAVR